MTKKTKNTKSIVSRNSRIASLVGFVFVALFTVAAYLPSSYAADNTEEECTEETNSASKTKAEFPREWNWKKSNISFDHMYRGGN